MAKSSSTGSATTKDSSSSKSNDSSNIGFDAILKETIVFMGIYVVSRWAVTYAMKQYQQKDSQYPSSKSSLQRLQNIFSSKSKSDTDKTNSSSNDSTTATRTRPKLSDLRLNQYEAAIASDVIDPSQIPTRFKDIGGIDSIKSELWDLVVLPLLRPDLFSSPSGLVSPPRGVLLYGAPGTGKTMLAKAIAAEGSAAFINVRLSSIMDKWFGESNKLVSATFSLAEKLAPSVIFIDELDTFLNQRDGSENSATSSMKSEFLTLWDGMLTREGKDHDTVMVLGATNRPFDVDSAILRRLPRTFEIGLPPESSRLQILQLILEKQEMTLKAKELIPKIAKVTVGYSGSDLKELCRAAAMEPIRELMRESSRLAVSGGNPQQQQNGQTTEIGGMGPAQGVTARPVDERDFFEALKKVKRTGATAMDFQRRESQNRSAMGGNPANNSKRQVVNVEDLARGMQMLQHVLAAQSMHLRPDMGNGDGPQDDGDQIPDLSNE